MNSKFLIIVAFGLIVIAGSCGYYELFYSLRAEDLRKAKDVLGVIQGCVSIIAVLAGAIWAYWKFEIQGEGIGKIQIDLSLRDLGVIGERRIVELAATVENKGKTRHSFDVKNFTFSLRDLPNDGAVLSNPDKNGQADLSQAYAIKRQWLPSTWDSAYLEAGVKQEITYLTAIPKDARLLSIFVRLGFKDSEREYQTAQRTFSFLKNEGISTPSAV